MDITKACRDVNELKPVAKQACLMFLQKCKEHNIDIFVTETYRSQARQNYLYEQGRTRPGKEITWTRTSNHTGRMAWDIATRGEELYDDTILNEAGLIAKRLGIEWGGTWDAKNLDKPHFQVSSNWKVPAQQAVVDGKLRRIFTGTFATEKSAIQFKSLVEKAFNIKLQMRKEDNRYRLYTGTFTNKTNAYEFKGKVEKRFAVTLQIREE